MVLVLAPSSNYVLPLRSQTFWDFLDAASAADLPVSCPHHRPQETKQNGYKHQMWKIGTIVKRSTFFRLVRLF